ncbi:hypothetical protein PR202_gb23106 [Eleusine coracana subsp. coracana]|uniref:cellulase n=1 Tax=Eleusine coracana subsp. coracana TaxID=191504 RepID=A0AAV5FI00_ELECO|nr:hypothetical protein PR202_gb23106 [Eleusine coracana subsp. coracana]
MVAGETAAAFGRGVHGCSARPPRKLRRDALLVHATKAFEFADTYKGGIQRRPGPQGPEGVRSTATSMATRSAAACPVPCSLKVSRLSTQDELLWGAAWLRRASGDDTFLEYIQNNGKTLGAEDTTNEFGWDNKHAGVNVLVSKVQGYFH